jgi:hypothetical protein
VESVLDTSTGTATTSSFRRITAHIYEKYWIPITVVVASALVLAWLLGVDPR